MADAVIGCRLCAQSFPVNLDVTYHFNSTSHKLGQHLSRQMSQVCFVIPSQAAAAASATTGHRSPPPPHPHLPQPHLPLLHLQASLHPEIFPSL